MNAYTTLGVSPKDPLDAIKKRYRSLAQKWHPDKMHGNTEQFTRIQTAWDWISQNHTSQPQPSQNKNPESEHVLRYYWPVSFSYDDMKNGTFHIGYLHFKIREDSANNISHLVRLNQQLFSVDLTPKMPERWTYRMDHDAHFLAHIHEDGSIHVADCINPMHWAFHGQYQLNMSEQHSVVFTPNYSNTQTYRLVNRGFFGKPLFITISMRSPVRWYHRMIRSILSWNKG